MAVHIGSHLQWLRSRHAMLLASVLFVVGGVWAFVALADAVEENETRRFDNRIINYCRQHPGPPWLADVGRDLTALGGITVMTLLTLVVCGYLLISGKTRATVLVLVAVIGGLLISSVIKHYVSRELQRRGAVEEES